MEKIIGAKLLEQNLSPNTVKLYLFNLQKLNDGKADYKTLNFLLDPVSVLEKIKDFKPNTQRNIIIAVNKVLGLFKDQEKIKKVYDQYQIILNEKNSVLKKEEQSGEKSESQKKNWISNEQIKEKREELKEKTKSLFKKKDLEKSEYDLILQYVILSLYTLLPARRNADYLKMKIIKSTQKFDTLEKVNYLILGKNPKFSFGNFKSVKTHGRQDIDIPDDLKKVIEQYLKIKKGDSDLFLVHFDGKPFVNSNNITFYLNKALGGKVGSSLLRHIYLSEKYGEIKEQQKLDSVALGHTLGQQQDYIKQ